MLHQKGNYTLWLKVITEIFYHNVHLSFVFLLVPPSNTTQKLSTEGEFIFPVKMFRAIQDIADKVIENSCRESEDSYVITQEQKIELVSYMKSLGFANLAEKLENQLPIMKASGRRRRKVMP